VDGFWVGLCGSRGAGGMGWVNGAGSAGVLPGLAAMNLLQGKDFLGSFGMGRVVGVSNIGVNGARDGALGYQGSSGGGGGWAARRLSG